MSETRVQAATLLCRIFLHYLVLLSEWDGMLQLWIRILDIMDRLMNSGQGDSLVSRVPTTSPTFLPTYLSTYLPCPKKQTIERKSKETTC